MAFPSLGVLGMHVRSASMESTEGQHVEVSNHNDSPCLAPSAAVLLMLVVGASAVWQGCHLRVQACQQQLQIPNRALCVAIFYPPNQQPKMYSQSAFCNDEACWVFLHLYCAMIQHWGLCRSVVILGNAIFGTPLVQSGKSEARIRNRISSATQGSPRWGNWQVGTREGHLSVSRTMITNMGRGS